MLHALAENIQQQAITPLLYVIISRDIIIIWLAPRAGQKSQILLCDWLHEWARWSYLAGSVLPAVSRKKNFPENRVINPFLIKFVR